MPKWEVKYTTANEPNAEALPKDAEVKLVSPYPITFRRAGARLDLYAVPETNGAMSADLVASLKVGGKPIHLTVAEARALAAELNNLAHKRVQVKERQAAEERAAENRRRHADSRRLMETYVRAMEERRPTLLALGTNPLFGR